MLAVNSCGSRLEVLFAIGQRRAHELCEHALCVGNGKIYDVNTFMTSALRPTIEMSHEYELDLIKNKHHYELELLKNDHGHEIDKLKTELSVANWENLKKLKLVELRSFIDKFNEKKLDKTITVRTERFAKFAKENKDQLKPLNLETELFKQIFQSLYSKLCGSAHPIFNTEDRLEIGASHLEPREIQLMGFLWEAFPLPPEKLLIRTLDKSESVFTKYKN